MTDPELADRTYVEPLTPEVLAAIIERERPDAILPTVGGQTGLNLAVDLADAGTLAKFNVKLIGASIEAIKIAEDRLLFKDAMRAIGLDVPRSGVATSLAEATDLARTLGFPIVIRPSFTLGGIGGGIAYNVEEFRELAERGIELSPVHQILVEESVIGWKEFELEVMRDVADNFVVICSIENIDPMGVHTGDSITVAPILTLSDKEYQRMRDAARLHHPQGRRRDRRLEHPVRRQSGQRAHGRHRDEPARLAVVGAGVEGHRVSRSRRSPRSSRSAITSTKFPNDITRLTPASFEPTIDYVVVKIPRWNFEKFPQADRTLTTQMKSVGEVMAIGRTFKEAFMKAVQSLELGAQRAAVRPGRSRSRRRRRCRKRRGAAQAARGAPRSAHVGSVPRDRSRLVGRAPPRRHPHRPVVPAAVHRNRRSAPANRRRGPRGAVAGSDAADEARRLRRRRARARARHRRSHGARPAYRAGTAAGLQARRYLRGGVRVVHAVHVQLVRADVRVEPERPRQGRHSRQRTQPDRTGDRVRLLLLSRGVRPSRGTPRDGDDQLQPRNRLDRLRHRRPPATSSR